jgi:uncharacterized coiled-coil protein SlyX
LYAGMSDVSERLEKIESHLAHLERQYEELNEVVIEQGRLLARLQREHAKTTKTVQTMELERIRANNPKPPHYQ